MRKIILFVAALACSAGAMADDMSFQKVANFGYVAPGAIVSIDMEGKGYPSVLYMERASDKRSIYIENNNGILNVHPFEANAGIPNFGIPFHENPGMVVMDVNHDGKQDLVVAGGWPPTLDIYLNNGTGGFTKDNNQPNLYGARDWENSDFLAAGDYDNDGWTDLFVLGMTYDPEAAAENMRLSIYRNNNGIFEKPDQSLVGCRSGSIAVGDVNGDGNLDVFYTGYGCGYETHLYYGNGAGQWTAEMNVLFDEAIKGDVAILDFDNDGYMDLMEQGREHGGTTIYKNNGDGTYTKKPYTETALHANTDLYIDYGDFNLDGKIDIIASGWNIGTNGESSCIFLNNGDFTFTRMGLAENARGGVFAWDYDADSKCDYIAWCYSDKLPDGSNGWYAPVVHNTTVKTSTDLDEIVPNPDSAAQKIVRDGQILIIHDGKVFNMLGTVF